MSCNKDIARLACECIRAVIGTACEANANQGAEALLHVLRTSVRHNVPHRCAYRGTQRVLKCTAATLRNLLRGHEYHMTKSTMLQSFW